VRFFLPLADSITDLSTIVIIGVIVKAAVIPATNAIAYSYSTPSI